MPLLDISIPHSSFTNKLYSIRFHRLHHASFLSGNPKTTRLNSSHNLSETQLRRNRLVVRAVATLEQQPVSTGKSTDKSADNEKVNKAHLVSSEKSPVEDDRELLRRKRISNANKGRGAWNKGIKHSPETRQKIRERTRIAMSRPQVKMKLVKGIHNQTQETRLKIAASVRLTWDRKRFNRRMIARCHREWLNLIAEASRSGFCGEEELQWDSYNVINQQLGNEFREGIESRKETRGSSPGVRAPKSLEQRKKISEAIAAKWADPVYRDRVYSGIAKQRGKDPEIRDPEWGTKKKEPKKVKHLRNLSDPKIRSQQAKLKSKSDPVKPPQARFKDPQARYKLEMIKSIRAQRAASDPKISETILKANILIGEAKRAAEALEVAAANSPLAAASLIETRKLIAEAMSYIKSVEMGSGESPGTDLEKEEVVEGVTEIDQRGVNGTGTIETAKFGEGGLQVQANVNGTEHIDISSSSSLSSSSKTSILSSWSDLTLKTTKVKADGEKQDKGGKGKRWVCGRLVDVEDEDEEDEKQEEEEDEDQGQDDQ